MSTILRTFSYTCQFHIDLTTLKKFGINNSIYPFLWYRFCFFFEKKKNFYINDAYSIVGLGYTKVKLLKFSASLLTENVKYHPLYMEN